jgi:hypothetical protein
MSHYFWARLRDQFDAVLHFDETARSNRSSAPPSGTRAKFGRRSLSESKEV